MVHDNNVSAFTSEHFLDDLIGSFALFGLPSKNRHDLQYQERAEEIEPAQRLFMASAPGRSATS